VDKICKIPAAYIAALVIVIGMAAPDAYAGCGVTINTANVNCSADTPGVWEAGPILTSADGDVTNTLDGWLLNVAGFRSNAPSGSNTLVANGTTISTSNQSTALHVFSNTGDVSVITTGGLLETVNNGLGLFAQTGGGGKIVIDNGSAISTVQNGISAADAIKADKSGSSGALQVTNRGQIDTVGGGIGISATSLVSSAGGLVDVDNSGAITTNGDTSYGIFASARGGPLTVNNSGALVVKGGGFSVGINAMGYNSAPVTVRGSGAIDQTNAGGMNAYGAVAAAATNGSGAMKVEYSGPVTTRGWSGGYPTMSAAALAAIADTGDAEVYYDGAHLESYGRDARAIYAASNSGKVMVTAQGNLITHANSSSGVPGGGSNAHGIYAVTTTGNDVNVRFTGEQITVAGQNSCAILASTTGGTDPAAGGDGSVRVNNDGGLSATGSQGHGIQVVTNGGDQGIANTGAIAASGAGAHGIYSATASGPVIIYNEGAVNASVNGIAAYTGGSWSVNVNNEAPGSLFGGANGVYLSGGFGVMHISNRGTIGAASDSALRIDSPAESLDLDNDGVINGYLTMAGQVELLFTNQGQWNLRNFNSASGTLAVALADFGATSGAADSRNEGVIALHGAGGAVPAAIDTAGQYLPLGNANNAMTAGGPVQGQIKGAGSLHNAGVIDLTANPAAGDVLVISGGPFIADGGKLLINTVLNEGGANSKSDVLVLDSTQLGAGAVTLAISPSGSGQATVGDGILVVEVKGASASGVFQMEPPVLTAGGIEYQLYQGDASGANMQNWYLRGISLSPPPPPPPPQSGSANPIPTLHPAALALLALATAMLVFGYRRQG